MNSEFCWFSFFLGSFPLEEYVRTYSILRTVSFFRFNSSLSDCLTWWIFGFVGIFGFRMIASAGGTWIESVLSKDDDADVNGSCWLLSLLNFGLQIVVESVRSIPSLKSSSFISLWRKIIEFKDIDFRVIAVIVNCRKSYIFFSKCLLLRFLRAIAHFIGVIKPKNGG